MAERVITGVERWATRIIIFCAVGTCLCLAGFAYLLVRVSEQAHEGQMARKVQQLRQPVAEKVYEWAHEQRKITDADLACFRDSALCDAP